MYSHALGDFIVVPEDHCGVPLLDTGCSAPNCTGFWCGECGFGCDAHDPQGQCATAVAGESDQQCLERIAAERQAWGLPPLQETMPPLLLLDNEQILVNVHPPERCAGRTCVVHNPTDHHMRPWPVAWRDDNRFDRFCPHGIGHPDPDQFVHWEQMGLMGRAEHDCDGCCQQIVLELEQ